MRDMINSVSHYVCAPQFWGAILSGVLLISAWSCQAAGETEYAAEAKPAEENKVGTVPEGANTPEANKAVDPVELARGSTADGVTLEIPSVLRASYPVEVKISGPIRGEGHQLRTVPADQGPNARATNPESVFNIRGGETSVSLHAPYPPGNYELVYVSPGRRSTLLSVPFTVIAPKAEISAPDTAEAGKEVPVKVVGEISPNTKIMIVPADSPPTLVGDHAFLKGDDRAIPALDGSSKDHVETVNVQLRLAKPGQYEIQYVTMTSHVVYARKPLTIK